MRSTTRLLGQALRASEALLAIAQYFSGETSVKEHPRTIPSLSNAQALKWLAHKARHSTFLFSSC